jgi:hypothetical protein
MLDEKISPDGSAVWYGPSLFHENNVKDRTKQLLIDAFVPQSFNMHN